MLRPRLTPCLLMSDGGLVKTKKFSSDRYIGDPLNAIRIFNEKKADELILLDIDATTKKLKPNFELIKSIAEVCRMPLCYGGGISKLEDAQRLVDFGVEKIAISSYFLSNFERIKPFTNSIGSQSVVCVLDVKYDKGFFNSGYYVYIHNGTLKIDIPIKDIINLLQDFGVGEIVINSIDRDGTSMGYDFDLVNYVTDSINIPVTFLGGASSLEDVSLLYKTYGICGAGAGSLFVFKGKYRAVLINYPILEQKYKIF